MVPKLQPSEIIKEKIIWSRGDKFLNEKKMPPPHHEKILWSRGDKFQMKKKIAPTPHEKNCHHETMRFSRGGEGAIFFSSSLKT